MTRQQIMFWGWVLAFTMAVTFSIKSNYDTNQHQQDAIGRVTRFEQREDARDCVNMWRQEADIRDMAEFAYRKNAATLISFADPNPPRTARYREQVERDVAEIRGQLPDPTCDLDEARKVLE